MCEAVGWRGGMRRNNNEKRGKGEQRVRVGVKEEGEGVGREVCVGVCVRTCKRERTFVD